MERLSTGKGPTTLRGPPEVEETSQRSRCDVMSAQESRRAERDGSAMDPGITHREADQSRSGYTGGLRRFRKNEKG